MRRRLSRLERTSKYEQQEWEEQVALLHARDSRYTRDSCAEMTAAKSRITFAWRARNALGIPVEIVVLVVGSKRGNPERIVHACSGVLFRRALCLCRPFFFFFFFFFFL